MAGPAPTPRDADLLVRLRRFLPLSWGVDCPVCGHRTDRDKTPWRFRVFRLFSGRSTYRVCPYCKWKGVSLWDRGDDR